MLKKVLVVAATALFIQPVFASSSIITANSFKTVETLLQQDKQPQQTLLVMDNDDTLTMMPCASAKNCQYLGGPAWYQWQSQLSPADTQRVAKDTAGLLAISNLIFTATQSALVDPEIPNTLKMADDEGVSLLVSTDRGYPMSNATESSFNNLGIMAPIEKNALKTASGDTGYASPYLPTPWDQNPVRSIAYMNGVLYGSGQNKGMLIEQLLQKTGNATNIRTIIFVDDTYKNVQNVADAYQNNTNVNAICIYFNRLETHKNNFLTGKNAKKLQAIATQQWTSIHAALTKNLPGLSM